MRTLDKKCLTCPVRKYALKSIHILRNLYELQEQILDVMDEFECNIVDVQNETGKVIYNEFS